MILRARIVVGLVTGLLLTLAAGAARADQDALLEQMTAYNKAAVAAYSDGDFDKAKAQLMKAINLSKKDSELLQHPMMARTYLHLGVLYVDGLEDRKTGVKFFQKALKIRPDIQVSEALATKTVKSAFDEASGSGGGGEPSEATASDEGAAGGGGEEAKTEPKMSAKEARQAAKQAAAEQKRQEAEEREAAKQAAAEQRMKDREAQAEKSKIMKDLAKTSETAEKERSAREKLERDREKREELLGEAKTALQQLQREKQENEKQAARERQEAEKARLESEKLAAKEKADLEQRTAKERSDLEKSAAGEKTRLEKELAQVKESEAKERAAKEKVMAEKAEKERLLVEAKAAIQQLQKEKADRDKTIADGLAREKKERDTKEALQKDKQTADQRDKERRAREDAERQERERLAAGPDMPSHFSEAIYCAMPDEVPAGSDLYIHCAPKSNNAKALVFYYRPAGSITFNAVTLELFKKGWHAGVIPAAKLTGKTLQYYTEARDVKGNVVATVGKSNSPNILSLKGGGATTAMGRRAPRSR